MQTAGDAAAAPVVYTHIPSYYKFFFFYYILFIRERMCICLMAGPLLADHTAGCVCVCAATQCLSVPPRVCRSLAPLSLSVSHSFVFAVCSLRLTHKRW